MNIVNYPLPNGILNASVDKAIDHLTNIIKSNIQKYSKTYEPSEHDNPLPSIIQQAIKYKRLLRSL